MSQMFETVEYKVTHDLDSKSNAPFIGTKIGAMQGCHGWFDRVFCTEKKLESRNFLREIGKIFGNHLGFDIQDVPFAKGSR